MMSVALYTVSHNAEMHTKVRSRIRGDLESLGTQELYLARRCFGNTLSLKELQISSFGYHQQAPRESTSTFPGKKKVPTAIKANL